jgi:hypothetical protein
MRNVARILGILSVVVLSLVVARPASAQTTFDLTWSGPYGSGNAVLTATNEGGGTYNVTAISGTQGAFSLTGLTGYGGADNDIFPAAVSPSGIVDFAGLGFTDSTDTSFNIFYSTGQDGLLNDTYYECNSTIATTCSGSNVTFGVPLTSISVSQVSATPEPSSTILFSTGLLAFVLLALKKR